LVFPKVLAPLRDGFYLSRIGVSAGFGHGRHVVPGNCPFGLSFHDKDPGVFFQKRTFLYGSVSWAYGPGKNEAPEDFAFRVRGIMAQALKILDKDTMWNIVLFVTSFFLGGSVFTRTIGMFEDPGAGKYRTAHR